MEQHKSFAGLDGTYGDRGNAGITILPVPYDKTSTWIKGADKGPLRIIEASPALELYDIETDFEVYKKGIHTCPSLDVNSSPEEMSRQVEAKVSDLLDSGKFVVTLGGEHSVSVGSIKAHGSRYEDLSVLQLDAHLDLRDEYEGSRFNHACVMARVKEICPIVQAGIRSMCIEEKAEIVPDDVFFAKDIVSGDCYINRVVQRLSPNVYVTIDVDVFDPSIMPSTGTPEPGGLSWYQVIRLLRSVTDSVNVVGFDVTELCPNESNKAPDFMAAKLVYKFLSYVYKNRPS